MSANVVSVHQPQGQPSRIVLLLHGTFGKRAKWLRRGSPFCTSLLRDLGRETAIRSVIWSGQHSVRAREQASHTLREYLRESLKEYGGVRHVVIGHSHGGSIALKAVAVTDLTEVDVVCLSTPILWAVPRPPLFDSNTFVWLVLSLPFFSIFAATLYYSDGSDWWARMWAMGVTFAIRSA